MLKKILITTCCALLTLTGSAVFAADEPWHENNSEDPGYAPDRVIVTFEEGVSDQRAENITANITGEDAVVLDDGITLGYVDEDSTVEETIDALEKNSRVAYAQPDFAYNFQDNEPGGTEEDDPTPVDLTVYPHWNLDKIDTQKAWDAIDKYKAKNPENPHSADGSYQRVKVAVLDSGTDLRHSDLQDVLDKEHSVHVLDGQIVPMDPAADAHGGDDFGHGTGVSGVLGASNNGVGITGFAAGNHNDLISILAVDVCTITEDQVRLAYTSDIIAGIEYAHSQGVRVINMSLGHRLNTLNSADSDDAALEKTINKYATGRDGMLFVCSGGNEKTTLGWYPSDFEATLGVINTKDYTSAYSKCKAPTSNYGKKKAIAAPGSNVYKTGLDNTYFVGGGTSAAAPAVAGVAAMVLYINPSMTMEKLKKTLLNTTVDLYTDGFDKWTAWGNVNACNAVCAAAGMKNNNKPARLKRPSFTISNIQYGAAILTWNQVSQADGYWIYRATKKNGKYKLVKTITKGTKLTYTDKKGLKRKTQYFYKIKAYGTDSNKKTQSLFSKKKKVKVL